MLSFTTSVNLLGSLPLSWQHPISFDQTFFSPQPLLCAVGPMRYLWLQILEVIHLPPYSSTRIYFVLLPLTFIPHFSPKQNFTRSLLSLQNAMSLANAVGYWSLMYLETPRVAWQRNYCLAGLTCAPHTPHILLCHSRLLIQSWKYPIFKLLLLRLKKKKKIWFTSFKEGLVAPFLL